MSSAADIRSLQPSILWNAFSALNAIPRPSKDEAAISKFVEQYGNRLKLETLTDKLGNVLIRKPATKGYEGHPTVVLQSHLDMVWQKNADTDFDFTKQGIQMYIDGDWIRARGTTLGADNGIGVATMLATLASTDLKHPTLECLFTIDEETGMTGAKELDATWLKGKTLLNLDTEQDDEMTIGCAGGANITATAHFAPEGFGEKFAPFRLTVKGLTGGHSGMDIHIGRGNANKILNRILIMASRKFGARVAQINGGGLRNAIPRESTSIIGVPSKNAEAFCLAVIELATTIRSENTVTDPDLQILCQPVEASLIAFVPMDLQRALLAAVSGIVSGIHRMSPSIPGLVQTSNNLAKVEVGDGLINILCLARSSVDSERDALCDDIVSILTPLGGEIDVSGQYPGWQPVPDSNIVKKMREIYVEMFRSEPHVAACHAGLECGIIGSKFPGMEMISFGPNITGAHSPDEKVQISSVQKFWKFYCETLARL